MTDREILFDRFLAESLAPPERAPDRLFVARVRQHILLDELLRRNRAKVVERLGIELLSLIALAGALAAVGISSEVADAVGEAPHLALIAVMLVFALWVTLIAGRGGTPIVGGSKSIWRVSSA